ncbi:MAG: FAD-binding oxidoreductase, partial [Gemmatimonadetes bacterium]|nr:FAD-binding oxidoreductase [Gemmatimonadota bacterium]
IVGPVPGHANVFVATGHAMLGLTLGPITGRLISELVLDKRPSMDIHALRVGRF